MTFLLNIGILLGLVALFLCFLSWRWSAGIAITGLALVFAAAPATVELTTLLFWAVTAALALALNVMLPPAVAKNRRGIGYIAGGALAGIFVGYLISRQWMVLGAVLGAALGGIAYSFTPMGRELQFPSSRFIQYLCAKGLPAVVTICIAAFTILEAFNAHTLS